MRMRHKLAAAAAAAALIAAGTSVASGVTKPAAAPLAALAALAQGPGCQGPQLSGSATPQLVLQTPQTLTVAATLTDNCPALSLAHTVLYLTGPQGWTITPSGARAVADLHPGGHDTLSWQVEVPAGTSGSGLRAQAIYDVGPHSTDSTVAAITAAVASGSLSAAFDNAGTSDDSNTGPSNLDGSGYGFSAQALAAAGVTPGSTVTAGGQSFTWPAAAAGAPDNVVAGGQAVLLSGTGSTLGFLATSTYGPASGSGTVFYTDGTTQSFTLTVPDWYSPPAGAATAITMAYRNAPGNAQDHHPVYVYYAGVPLQAGKTVQAVVLPDVSPSPPAAGTPALHIFAVSIG